MKFISVEVQLCSLGMDIEWGFMRLLEIETEALNGYKDANLIVINNVRQNENSVWGFGKSALVSSSFMKGNNFFISWMMTLIEPDVAQ